MIENAIFTCIRLRTREGMGACPRNLQGTHIPARRSHFQLVSSIVQCLLCNLSLTEFRALSARLAEILRLQAALLEHIVTEQRYYSDYFRVAFYGNFPVGIRNKQFVVGLVSLFSHHISSCFDLVPRLRMGEIWSLLRTNAQQAPGCTTAEDLGRSSRRYPLRQRSVHSMHCRCSRAEP